MRPNPFREAAIGEGPPAWCAMCVHYGSSRWCLRLKFRPDHTILTTNRRDCWDNKSLNCYGALFKLDEVRLRTSEHKHAYLREWFTVGPPNQPE